MNLSIDSPDGSSDLLFVDFNQDSTSLGLGTRSGYRLYSLAAVSDKPEFVHERADGGPVCIIERLFSSSLVALVEQSNPRKLRLCHFKKNSEICTYSYPDAILAVRLNRQRLLVVLRQNLYIHNIRDMKVLHTIRDTPKNPAGLCALSADNDTALVAYPSSTQNGEVQVFDAIHLRAVAGITAHDSPIAALAFNPSGTKLATASTTGTVIRVFNIPQGEKLIEFRRGMKRFIQISSLAFSVDSNYLVTSSSTETVHVFRLAEPPPDPQPEEPQQQGWMSYLGKAFSTPASYLPTQVTEPFSQSRAFAQLKLPKAGLRSVCSIACVDGVHRILVASSEAMLYVASIDPKEGGECRYKQFNLLSDPNADDISGQSGLAFGTPPEHGLTASPLGSHGSHMTPPPHEDEDDTPPKTHSVHS